MDLIENLVAASANGQLGLTEKAKQAKATQEKQVSFGSFNPSHGFNPHRTVSFSGHTGADETRMPSYMRYATPTQHITHPYDDGTGYAPMDLSD